MSGDETRAVGPARGPLNGVRVLELGNFIAAPTAGRMLAEFGADVGCYSSRTAIDPTFPSPSRPMTPDVVQSMLVSSRNT